MQLTAKDISAISHTARSTKVRTRREAFFLLKLTDARLKADAAGQLTLAEGVYLPLAKVRELLWRVRKVAAKQWTEAKAAERTARALAGLPLFEDAADEGEATERMLTAAGAA